MGQETLMVIQAMSSSALVEKRSQDGYWRAAP